MLRLLRYKPSTHLRYSTAAAPPKPRPPSPPAVIDHTLTLYFLQKSCKLSPEAAAAVAQKINLKSTKNPHSILALLRDYGFSETHIVRLISSRPKLLLTCPTRNLMPKLDFYASNGLSVDDFVDHFCATDRLLLSSIKNRHAPNLELLRPLFPSEADLFATVHRYPASILSDLEKIVPVKSKALLDAGLTMDNILKMIANHPKCFDEEFDSSLAAVKELGINPTTSAFVHALAVISKVPKLDWESRMQSFSRLGWSRDQTLAAFTRHPHCMTSSEERLTKSLKFFKEKLGWGPDRLSISPVVISLSFERRIVPRYRVFKLLDERGLLKRGITPKHFLLGEQRFMNLYVHKYKETVPEIFEALGGHSSDGN